MAARVTPKPKQKPISMATKRIEIQILDDDRDDDTYISAFVSAPSSSGTNPKNAITVEDYHPSSSKSTRKRKLFLPNLDDDVQVLDSPPPPLSPSKRKTFTCEICADDRPRRKLFRITGCTHSYCSRCVVNYISARLDNGIFQIQCPVLGCLGILDPHHCRSILAPEVFDRWGKALCESTILESQKFYCPFKDCSALILADNNMAPTDMITQSECPYCMRLFCIHCKVPWHNEISCSDFQKLGKNEREKEDIMLMKLAQNKKWMRCPQCKIFIQKNGGCSHMQCRCGHQFNYTSRHASFNQYGKNHKP